MDGVREDRQVQTLTSELSPTAPFDFDLTAGYYASFRGQYGDDTLEPGLYRRAMYVNGRLLQVTTRSGGETERPRLEVEVAGDGVVDADIQAAREKVAWTLATATDLAPFYEHVAGDPVLGPATQQLYGLHPTRVDSVFEAMAVAVTAQQISTSVARHIRGLMVEAYGARLAVDGREYRAFPVPEVVATAGVVGLRAMKLSTRKAEYILDAASKAASGSLTLESLAHLPDQEAMAWLIGLRGVGIWTAQWLLIRALGRADAFPTGDLAMRRLISTVYHGGDPVTDAEAEKFSMRWSPWRSFATIYLFAASHRGLIPE